MQNYEIRQGGKKGQPWNAGGEIGTKQALKAQQVWAIRFWLDHQRRVRDRAMFDVTSDSKLRGYDIVKIKIDDSISGGNVRLRAINVQQKTSRPAQFELLESARRSILAWFQRPDRSLEDFVFSSRIEHGNHISTRQ